MSFKTDMIRIPGCFARDRRGNVLIVSALVMPVLIGMAALVTEYGGALVEQADNQRVADLSAYAGALAYNATKSTDQMTAAAVNVAVLNGIRSADVQAALVASPKTVGINAVSVSIRTHKNLFLARVLDSREELQIYAGSVAEVGAQAQTPGCVLALDATQTGITLSGGTAITAPSCTVSSNNTVTVPCGTSISAIGVNYNSAAAPTQPCGGITGPNGAAAVIAKKSTSDPLAGNAAVTSAVARFTSVAALTATTAPAAPTNTTGTNIDFAWDQTATKNAATTAGCTASWSQPTWTFSCGTKTVVNLGNVTIGGGINLNFAVNGAATTTYNFASDFTSAATTTFGPGIYNFAKTLTTAGTTTFGAGTYNVGKLVTTAGTTTFGAGTFNFSKGLTTGGGATTVFGAGTFKIGMSDSVCNYGSARVSVCNTSLLTFKGPSVFELPGGFNNTGGATLTFGSGTSNSYKIGPGSNGDAITLAGGATIIMADATSAGNVFQVIGNVNAGGGGSCFVVPAAAQHDIAGNFMASGAVVLGAGVYTVDGFFTLGSSGGGGASCNGGTVSVSGNNVTLVLSGKTKSSSGSCTGYVFCVAAGYSNISLTAPQTGATAKLAIIGPTSTSNTGGATFADGGSNAQISGAFYFPNGPIIMNGGSSILGKDATKCLQLIGSRITLSGGTAATSECIAASGATATSKVSLVQ